MKIQTLTYRIDSESIVENPTDTPFRKYDYELGEIKHVTVRKYKNSQVVVDIGYLEPSCELIAEDDTGDGECSIHGCPEFNKSESELPKVKSKPIDVEKMCKLAKSIRDEGKIEKLPEDRPIGTTQTRLMMKKINELVENANKD